MRPTAAIKQRRRRDDHEPLVQLGLAAVVDGRREQRREHEHVEQRAEQLRLARRRPRRRARAARTCANAVSKPDDDHEHAVADREAPELHVRGERPVAASAACVRKSASQPT